MVIEKSSLKHKTKRNIFTRIRQRFLNRQRNFKRDQSVQTSLHSPVTATIFSSTHLTQQISSIPIIKRAYRRTLSLKPSKQHRSTERLQVALVRKIELVNHNSDSPKVISSTTAQCSRKSTLNDETSRDEYISIGPLKWSTPNRTDFYKTSSPYVDNPDQSHRLFIVDQLSFSNIFDQTD